MPPRLPSATSWRGPARASTPSAVDFRPMQLLVFAAIALVLFLVGIGLGLGGTLAVLIFLSVLLVGAIVRVWTPLIEWIRGPAAKL